MFRLALTAIAVAGFVHAQAVKKDTGTIRVDADPNHVVNSFDPDQALGTSIDVQPYGLIDKIFAPAMIQQMLAAGWGPITYRNNSELRIAAWHWNPDGVWSDEVHKSGYFTGSADPTKFIRYIESYSLPHRGFSYSGGGASSLMKGGAKTYWKSNPYLTSRFTGEPDALHPQWVVIDLRAPKAVTTMQIDWENPFARVYEVDYWVGNSPMEREAAGEWKPFPGGKISDGKGGSATLNLAESPVTTRYVRIWMTESSGTCDLHGAEDIRNCSGYAISNIKIAGADTNDARIYTSSVDPWHSAADIAIHGSQHTGFDLFFTSGITNHLPAMIPVTMLYGTPEGAANEIAYIEKRGYPIGWIEMGEEPDGKHMLPEDYGALFLQWATAIHKVDPKLKLGGPVFEGMNEDLKVWPDAQGRTSWLGRFIDYLKAHRRLSDLVFMSFEHYPFDPCDITWQDLYKEPHLMSHILDVWRADGVPKNVPLMVTESNLSWNLSGPMSQIFAALWLSDSIGSFLESGGAAYYHSPIQPQPIHNTCLGWASWANFIPDASYHIKAYTSFYFAARLLNLEWVQHRAGMHKMFHASSDVRDGSGNQPLTVYPLQRPDGKWSLLVVNRDQSHSHSARITFENATGQGSATFSGTVDRITFGSDQYVWREDGPNSHPDPDGPPVKSTITAAPHSTFTFPKASITVLRGSLSEQ